MDTDVLIVGSGAAGMLAALESSRDTRVTMISKGPVGRDGATITAQADVAVDSRSCKKRLGLTNGNEADTTELFAEDMLLEGCCLGDAELIDIHTRSIPEEMEKLAGRGLKIRGLEHNPGHRHPRSVWISAVELCRLLRSEIGRSSIRALQYTVACDLIVSGGRISGVAALNMLTGTIHEIRAKATVLCAGGGMRLYPYSTSPRGLTGDGLAMAFRAGAEVTDMEFPMFLPYTLLHPKLLRGVTFTHDLAMLTNAHALNKRGERYIERWDPIRMERTTRDINATAAGMEIALGRGSPNGGTWLSLAHLPRNLIDEMGRWLPEGLQNWRYGGFNLKELLPNLSQEALETIPAAHFWNGGIVIDKDCKTSVPGLFAAGEGTAGLHGAGRISGNGLGQAIVWGVRAGRAAAKEANRQKQMPSGDNIEKIKERILMPLRKKDGPDPLKLAHTIREKAWQAIGLIRSGEGLEGFLAALQSLAGDAESQCAQNKEPAWNFELLTAIQNANMLDVACATASAAHVRKESRGAHYRADYPQTDGKWTRNIVLYRQSGKTAYSLRPAKNAFAAREDCRIRRYGDKGGILP